MSVHQIRAPVRAFHQCLICQKRFVLQILRRPKKLFFNFLFRYPNALVLQEHIKTHSGAPTELTLDQISAAEIKDFPHLGGLGGPFGQPSSFFNPEAPLPFSNPFERKGIKTEEDEEEERGSPENDRRSNGSFEASSDSGSASLTPDRFLGLLYQKENGE